MNSIISLLASTPPPVAVPDTGLTALLLGAGVVAVGLFARFLKNRKK